MRCSSRPLLLAAVGLASVLGLACGCIPLPTREVPAEFEKRTDFRPLVGPAGSRAAIRPGATTRAQVAELLGKPADVYPPPDPSIAVYECTCLTGRQYWLVGLGKAAPAGVNETFTDHRLFLRYGRDDVLSDYATFDGWDGWLIALEKFALATARHEPPPPATGPGGGPAAPDP